MKDARHYFECDECHNRNFKEVYNFSIRFHKVNFSDDMIYDKIVDEMFQCTECGKTFTKKEIEKSMQDIKKKYRRP